MPSVPIEMPSRDADRVEAQADQARRARALLHRVGEQTEVHVAGVAVVPHRRDAELRLAEILGA